MSVGSLLMRVFCARMDAAREDAYLETDKPENVLFYERFGFEVVGKGEVLGVTSRFMLRRAEGSMDGKAPRCSRRVLALDEGFRYLDQVHRFPPRLVPIPPSNLAASGVTPPFRDSSSRPYFQGHKRIFTQLSSVPTSRAKRERWDEEHGRLSKRGRWLLP